MSWTTQTNGATGADGIIHTAVVSADPASLPTPAVEEQRLESLLVAGGVSDSTRSAVLEQFQSQTAQIEPAKNSAPPNPVLASATKPVNPKQAASALEKQDQLLAGLLLGSPEFQRR
jgi:hypothetical protein